MEHQNTIWGGTHIWKSLSPLDPTHNEKGQEITAHMYTAHTEQHKRSHSLHEKRGRKKQRKMKRKHYYPATNKLLHTCSEIIKHTQQKQISPSIVRKYQKKEKGLNPAISP